MLLLLTCACSLQASFDDELSKYVHYTKGGPNHIGRIAITDLQSEISQATWLYVNAALTEYKKTKPACIILELNTPGGEVFAAQRISNALKEMDTQYGIPVVAYINNWAMSAGAMLAYSCRNIVISKDASMGAAEPVTFGAEGMESAPEKINSALRTDFANLASFYGRNPDIAEAMVDKDVILVERSGKIVKLESEDKIKKSDTIISPKGKLLTLTAKQLMQFHVADQMLVPQKLEPLSAAEQETESVPLDKTPFSQIGFFQKLNPCSIDTFTMNWQTRFMAFLSSPQIASLLFLGVVVGLYVEISTPGFGVAGVIGLLSLFFIILSSFALEAIHWLEPILFLFGITLVAMEFFFFPTLGILGVFGAIFTLVGLLGMMLPGIGSVSFSGDTLNAAGQYVLERLGWLSLSLLVSVLVIFFLSRYITPKFSLLKRLVLGDTQMLATGEHSMQVKDALPKVSVRIGDLAEVVTTLRPAGRIVLHGVSLDAVSTGSFIERGKKVRVMRVEGERIIVEEVFS